MRAGAFEEIFTFAPPGAGVEARIARVRAGTGFDARRALGRTMIAARLGCAPAEAAFGVDDGGAPLVAGPNAGLSVSFSGRDDLIAVALAAAPVGVDIEPVAAPFDPPLNVLHPAERAALARATDAHAHFMRLWVAKEAYLKALRTGLSREPSEIEIRLADDRAIAVLDRERQVALACAFASIVQAGDVRFALGVVVAA